MAEFLTDLASLTGLAGQFGAEKFRVYPHYIEAYAREAGPLRSTARRVLEFGLGCSEIPSLRTWRSWFDNAEVWGVDNSPQAMPAKLPERVHVRLGNQADASFVARIGEEVGRFDVVVDDAGHMPSQQLTCLRAFWPFVASGGVYVIEDLESSWWAWPGETESTTAHLGRWCESLQGPFVKPAQQRPGAHVPTCPLEGLARVAWYANVVFLHKAK